MRPQKGGWDQACWIVVQEEWRKAVSRPVAMDAFEAEKAKWLGGALGHVVRWRDASEVGQ